MKNDVRKNVRPPEEGSRLLPPRRILQRERAPAKRCGESSLGAVIGSRDIATHGGRAVAPYAGGLGNVRRMPPS